MQEEKKTDNAIIHLHAHGDSSVCSLDHYHHSHMTLDGALEATDERATDEGVSDQCMQSIFPTLPSGP